MHMLGSDSGFAVEGKQKKVRIHEREDRMCVRGCDRCFHVLSQHRACGGLACVDESRHKAIRETHTQRERGRASRSPVFNPLTSNAFRCSTSAGSSDWLKSAQQLNMVLIPHKDKKTLPQQFFSARPLSLPSSLKYVFLFSRSPPRFVDQAPARAPKGNDKICSIPSSWLCVRVMEGG